MAKNELKGNHLPGNLPCWQSSPRGPAGKHPYSCPLTLMSFELPPPFYSDCSPEAVSAGLVFGMCDVGLHCTNVSCQRPHPGSAIPSGPAQVCRRQVG